MKLGFNTLCLHKNSLEEVAEFAGEQGFSTLEVFCPPAEENRSTHIDVDTLDEEKSVKIKSLLEKFGLEISCLSWYTNPLAGENGQSQFTKHLTKLIDAASLLGVKNVSTFTGYIPGYSIEENINAIAGIFPPLLTYAGNKNVNILLENTPMLVGEDHAGNFAFSPEIWDLVFTKIPDSNFGLNYDPSHLYWLGIDYILFLKIFQERIFHVQAKDAVILVERLRMTGILGDNWFQYKLPGFGSIEWKKFIPSLYESGYDGVVSIENEDQHWIGSSDKAKRGLIFSKNLINEMIV
jgi:sugar phosphate isomerase/epimerase